MNETGWSQANAFFNAYRHIAFDHIYTSVLRRSQQSVRHFIELGIPHTAFSGLNEISWGTKEGQPITPQEDEYYHYMLDQWSKGETSCKIEGGESPEDVVKRLSPVVNHIVGQRDEKTILICMHGRAMRILLCYLLGYPLKQMDQFEHTNLCLYELNYLGDVFLLERSNDISHLLSLS